MYSSKSISLTLLTTGRYHFGKRCISKASSTPNILRFRSDLNCTRWAKSREHNNNRTLSTLQNDLTIASKDESREFVAVFPDILRALTDPKKNTELLEAHKWHEKVLQCNVPNGKKTRGLSLVSAYKMLEDPANLSVENVRLANILGWCVEMLLAYFLIADDIMDNLVTRRGAPRWYRTPGVGLTAVNDAFFLESGLYYILKRYFAGRPCYVPALELFHDISMKTVKGQSMDSLSHVDGKPNLDAFTMKRYNTIAKYKTAYCSYHLPVALAMFLAGNFDPELHRQAETILLKIGHFFQVQDDFLDCYGNSERTGKVGTDIQGGKCSWLVVIALERATHAQKETLYGNYGKSELKCVQAVKNLYEELNLLTAYTIYEEESFNLIRTHIQQISKGLPHNLFLKLIKSLYKRER